MSGRQKQQAITRKDSTTRNPNTSGRGNTVKEVESPPKNRKGSRTERDDEHNACAVALAEARSDVQAEIEAFDHHADVTPPPEIHERVSGPAAATVDRQRALGQKEANDKAAEAE